MTDGDARAFWMTKGVTRMMRLSLTDALAAGRLDAAAYDGIIARCAACSVTETCATWLSGQTGQAVAAPSYCANQDVLDRLSSGRRA